MGRGSAHPHLARAFAVATITLGSIWAVASGCRDIAGIDDRGISARCSAASFADATCGECTDLRCCTALAACSALPSCASDLACLAGCPTADASCRAACTSRGPLGPELAAVSSCQAVQCASACNVTCGAPLTPSDRCTKCLATDCCDATTKCAADPSCLELRLCQARCPRLTTCSLRCEASFPNGHDRANAVEGCEKEHCAAECGAWTCSSSQRPLIERRNLTITIVANTPVRPTKGVKGLVVRDCPLTDRACVTTLSSVPVDVTDGSGRAQFTIETGAALDHYYVLEDPNGVYATTAVRAAPALTDNATISVIAITREQLKGLNPTKGVVVVRAHDCVRAEGAGIHYELVTPDSGATPFYFKDDQIGPPSTNRTQGYDHVSLGGFVDVLEQPTAVVGSLAIEPPQRILEVTLTPFAGLVTYIDYEHGR